MFEVNCPGKEEIGGDGHVEVAHTRALSARDEMAAPLRVAESIFPSAVMATLTRMRGRFIKIILIGPAWKWRKCFIGVFLWYTFQPWE